MKRVANVPRLQVFRPILTTMRALHQSERYTIARNALHTGVRAALRRKGFFVRLCIVMTVCLLLNLHRYWNGRKFEIRKMDLSDKLSSGVPNIYSGSIPRQNDPCVTFGDETKKQFYNCTTVINMNCPHKFARAYFHRVHDCLVYLVSLYIYAKGRSEPKISWRRDAAKGRSQRAATLQTAKRPDIRSQSSVPLVSSDFRVVSWSLSEKVCAKGRDGDR